MIRKKTCWRPLCSDEGIFLVEDIADGYAWSITAAYQIC